MPCAGRRRRMKEAFVLSKNKREFRSDQAGRWAARSGGKDHRGSSRLSNDNRSLKLGDGWCECDNPDCCQRRIVITAGTAERAMRRRRLGRRGRRRHAVTVGRGHGADHRADRRGELGGRGIGEQRPQPVEGHREYCQPCREGAVHGLQDPETGAKYSKISSHSLVKAVAKRFRSPQCQWECQSARLRSSTKARTRPVNSISAIAAAPTSLTHRLLSPKNRPVL